MVVVVDKEEHDAKNNGDMTVKKALEDTARGGRLGALKVDPESLTLREPGIFNSLLLQFLYVLIVVAFSRFFYFFENTSVIISQRNSSKVLFVPLI